MKEEWGNNAMIFLYDALGDYRWESFPLREKMYFSKIWERTADWLGGVDRDNYFDFWYIENFIFW